MVRHWEQGRTVIEALIKEGRLERVPPSRAQAEALIAEARRHLASAKLVLASDPAGAYALLYDAARKGLAGVLENEGLRPKSFGGHIALYERAVAENYLDQQISDAAALAAQLRITDATVVGHSCGGLVAIGLALRHPDAVGRLVLMEPPLHVKKHPTVGFLRAFLGVQLARRRRGDLAAAQAFLRYASSRTTGPSTYDQLPATAGAALDADAAGTLAELDAGTGEQIHTRQVATIAVPALLLEGALSQPVFRKASSRLSARLPHAQVQVLPRAGHMMQIDAPRSRGDQALPWIGRRMVKVLPRPTVDTAVRSLRWERPGPTPTRVAVACR